MITIIEQVEKATAFDKGKGVKTKRVITILDVSEYCVMFEVNNLHIIIKLQCFIITIIVDELDLVRVFSREIETLTLNDSILDLTFGLNDLTLTQPRCRDSSQIDQCA